MEQLKKLKDLFILMDGLNPSETKIPVDSAEKALQKIRLVDMHDFYLYAETYKDVTIKLDAGKSFLEKYKQAKKLLDALNSVFYLRDIQDLQVEITPELVESAFLAYRDFSYCLEEIQIKYYSDYIELNKSNNSKHHPVSLLPFSQALNRIDKEFLLLEKAPVMDEYGNIVLNQETGEPEIDNRLLTISEIKINDPVKRIQMRMPFKVYAYGHTFDFTTAHTLDLKGSWQEAISWWRPSGKTEESAKRSANNKRAIMVLNSLEYETGFKAIMNQSQERTFFINMPFLHYNNSKVQKEYTGKKTIIGKHLLV